MSPTRKNTEKKKNPTKKQPDEKDLVRRYTALEEGRTPRGDVVTAGARLPIAYLKILKNEADLLEIGRGQLLTLIFKRKIGEIAFERSKDAPQDYDFSDEELTTTHPYIWYVSPKTKAAMDADRMQMGFTSVAAWIVYLLNDWIGRPRGLRSRMLTEIR